jgi:hypothetical protein
MLRVAGWRGKSPSSVVQRWIIVIFFEKETMSCPLAQKNIT